MKYSKYWYLGFLGFIGFYDFLSQFECFQNMDRGGDYPITCGFYGSLIFFRRRRKKPRCSYSPYPLIVLIAMRFQLFLEMKAKYFVSLIEIKLVRPIVLDVGVQFNGLATIFERP